MLQKLLISTLVSVGFIFPTEAVAQFPVNVREQYPLPQRKQQPGNQNKNQALFRVSMTKCYDGLQSKDYFDAAYYCKVAEWTAPHSDQREAFRGFAYTSFQKLNPEEQEILGKSLRRMRRSLNN